MPEAALLPSGTITATDLLNFLRPSTGNGTVPLGFKQSAATLAQTLLQIAVANGGIPLSPDGNVRAVYDASVPLVPKVRVFAGNLCILSLDTAGNLIVAGTVNSEQTP